MSKLYYTASVIITPVGGRPLWWPSEPHRACNGITLLFTTSTPPMVRTAITEPQGLYKGALYLYLYLTDNKHILSPMMIWSSYHSDLTRRCR